MTREVLRKNWINTKQSPGIRRGFFMGAIPDG